MLRPLCRSQPKKLGLGQGTRDDRCRADGKTEPAVVASVGMGPAAGEAGLGAPERTYTTDFAAALRTMVDVFAFDATRCGEWQCVAPSFSGQPEIVAGETPFGPVRIDETTRIARMGNKMRQFVEKRAGQFLGKREQTRIEQNHRAIEPRQTRGGAQPRVPMQGDTRGQLRKFEARSPRAGLFLQLPQHFRRVKGAGLQGAGRHAVRWNNRRGRPSSPWRRRAPALPRNKRANLAERCA